MTADPAHTDLGATRRDLESTLLQQKKEQP
jgi:hypothetical protein